jgi:Outer membrane protein beta-barrel domain
MKSIFTLFVFSMVVTAASIGQSSKAYYSVGGEMIFSFADMEDQGREANSLMRWAPVFNLQGFINSDISQHFGLFSGLAIRNVGYIYDEYQDTDPLSDIVYKKKFRTYNLGIPVGFKIGNLSSMYFYGGYEIEFPFHYKEKTFDDGDKIDKITGWFSNRTENFQHGLLAGIQFPEGINLKFKYYFSEFHNQDFTDSAGNKPYAGLKSNVFYFSLSYAMFRDVKDAYDMY